MTAILTAIYTKLCSFQFSCSVVSDSLWPHESQHARPRCPSPSPGVHPDSRPSSQWCHPAISSSVFPFSSCLQSLPTSEFSNESTLCMRWPKYWSFSFSIIPSKEPCKNSSPEMKTVNWFYLVEINSFHLCFIHSNVSLTQKPCSKSVIFYLCSH